MGGFTRGWGYALVSEHCTAVDNHLLTHAS